MAEDLFYTRGSAEEILAALPALRPPPASARVAGLRVAVVGGSVGGLACAACLRAAGVRDVAVFERSDALGAGAGISLDDASLAALKGLGAADGLALRPMR